jgi:hypothetical protein
VALQKQHIPLSIVDGIDTKTDEKGTVATKWLTAENIVFNKTMAASKDNGFTALTADVAGAAALAEGTALATFKNELLQYSANKLYSYSEAKSKWFDKGYVSSALSTQNCIDVTESTVATQDFATLSGISCYAYTPTVLLTVDSYAKIRFVDNTTGAILQEHTITSGDPTVYAVGTVGNYFVIIVETGGDLKYYSVDISDLSTISAATTISTDYGGYATCLTIGSRLYIAWANDTTNDYDIVYLDSSLVQSATTSTPVASFFTNISLSKEGTDDIRMCYENYSVLFDSDLVQQHVPVAFNATMPATNRTATQDPDNANASIVLYHDDEDLSAQIGIKKARITSAGTVTDLGFVMYAANLASQAVTLNGQVYALATKKINDSSDLGTRTYFLISKEGQVVAKCADEVGIRVGAGPLKRAVADDSASTVSIFSAEFYEFFELASPSTSTATSVNKYIFDLSSSNNFFDAELGEQLHIAGSVMHSYDGNGCVEHGFLELPIFQESDVVASDCSPSLGVGSGSGFPQTKQYCLVFAWADAKGQIHRSAPSIPQSVTIPDATTKVTISCRPLTITSKRNVEIEVYATEGDGTIFYKTSSLALSSSNNGRVDNDPTAVSISFVDMVPDSDIIDKEILYTTGGVLENIAPISSRYAVSNKSRIFVLSGDGYTVQYSKIREDKTGVGFSDAQTVPLDKNGGEGVALAVLDEHLVILKRKGLLILAGEGPNNLGEQNDYKQPITIPTDAGCEDAGSVVTTPMGILFKSAKGIYILRRNLTVEYVGAPVEAFNSLTITSATLLDKVNQVRFTTADGTCLTYDYFHNRWSTRVNVEAVDGLLYQDNFTFLKSNGVVWKQGASVWSDNGAYIPMKLESSWVQFANVQGYQRFYQLLILGTFKNSHRIKVSFAYDFSPDYEDSVTIDTSTLFSTSGELYQLEIGPKKQKCQSFRFKIETLTNAVYGEDVTFSNFSLLIGSKGMTKKGAPGYAAG